MKAYVPINCHSYDEQGETREITSKVIDLRTENKIEYLITDQQLKIRLDLLLSINGKQVEMTCVLV